MMETVTPSRLAISELQPHVADFLYQTSRRFRCPLVWERSSDGGIEKVGSAPLADQAGERVSAANAGLYRHVSADLWQGEQTWHFSGTSGFTQGSSKGYIRLHAGLRVKFGVTKGFLMDTSHEASSWLCWADEYRLEDGTTCFRLSTLAGDVWLRGAENPAAGRKLVFALARSETAPVSLGHKVVMLTSWSYRNVITDPPVHTRTPWNGLSNVGAGDREWCVVDDSLTLAASLELTVAGRYNSRLAGRECHVIEAPYDLVWQRGDQVIPFF